MTRLLLVVLLGLVGGVVVVLWLMLLMVTLCVVGRDCVWEQLVVGRVGGLFVVGWWWEVGGCLIRCGWAAGCMCLV